MYTRERATETKSETDRQTHRDTDRQTGRRTDGQRETSTFKTERLYW